MSNIDRHNRELEELYKKAEAEVLGKVAEYNKKQQDESYCAAFPLFLKSNEDYENAEIKVMLFGQETNSWYGIYGKNDVSVEKAMGNYEECFFGHNNGAFFPGIRKFIYLSNEKMPTGKIGCLCNNIVKMGYNGKGKGFPDNFYKDIVKPHLNNLILKEIEILKPDCIVFLTMGKPYSDVLNDVFGKLETRSLDGFDAKGLCEIILPSEKAPSVKRAFRTYHPSYPLRSGKGEDFMNPYFNKIIEEIFI